MFQSGEHPEYKHFCGHPASVEWTKEHERYGVMLRSMMYGDEDGRAIGDTDNTPDWCPVVAERLAGKVEPSAEESPAALARDLKTARAEMSRSRCAAELEDAKDRAEEAIEKLLSLLWPGEVELPEQPPMRSLQEVAANIRALPGGNAWDKIEDPEKYIRDMRGEPRWIAMSETLPPGAVTGADMTDCAYYKKSRHDVESWGIGRKSALQIEEQGWTHWFPLPKPAVALRKAAEAKRTAKGGANA
jgi:hypothetical protein